MANLVGKTLKNRYRVEDSLGRGGMADVYKVWDEQRSTYLALKLLRDDLAQDPVFMRRFKREAQNLASLQHPNIVRFYGLEVDDLKAFILMEYIEGTTLREEILRAGAGGLELERVQQVMGDVCSALQYAHNKGLVHCDIKSGNILVDASGKAYLTDFGIARGMDAATSTMVGVGTPAYMAPELIRGEDPTPQTDIYALGIVLYEMLTGGERPFTGERATITGTTAEKVRWEHLNILPTPLTKYNEHVSEKVQKIVNRSLTKFPKERYRDTRDMEDEIRNISNISDNNEKDWESIQVIPDHKLSIDKKNKIVIASIIVVFIIYFFMGWKNIKPQFVMSTEIITEQRNVKEETTETVTEQRNVKEKTTETVDIIENKSFEKPTESVNDKSNQSTNMLAGKEVGGLEAIGLDNINKLQLIVEYDEIHKSGDQDWYLDKFILSSDGSTIIIVTIDGLFAYDISTMKEIWSKKIYPLDLTLSHNGKILAIKNNTGDLMFIDPFEGSLIKTISENDSSGGSTFGKNCLSFSPNDSLIASGCFGNTVSVWDFKENKEVQIFKMNDQVSAVTFSPDGERLATGSAHTSDEFDGDVVVWDVRTGAELFFYDDVQLVRELIFTDNNDSVISGTTNGHIKQWRTSGNGSLENVFDRENMTGICQMNKSPDGKILVNSSFRDMIVFWDIETGEELHRIDEQKGVCSVEFSPDGKYLIAASSDGIIRIWGVTKQTDISDLSVNPDIDIDSDKHTIDNDDELITINNIQKLEDELLYSSQEYTRYRWGYGGGIIDFSNTEKNIFAFTINNKIILFDLNTKKELSHFQAQLTVNDIAFYNHESHLVSGSEGQELIFWDYLNGSILQSFDGSISWTDKARVTSVAVSTDDRLVANGSNDSLRLWDAENGRLLDFLDGKSNHIMSVVFSPDGKHLASGSREGKIMIWNVGGSKLIANKRLMGHTGPITSLEFSPDGKFLISGTNSVFDGTSDCSVRIWDVNTGELVHILIHEKPIVDIAISKDSKLLITSTWRGVYFWSIEEGSLVASREGSGGYITCMDFSADGELLVTITNKNEIYLWRIANDLS